MESGSPLIIVSAFGRGHWLAAEAAKEGIPTALIDVTSHLGVWPPEDVEGPFGFFRSDKFSVSQMERLYSEDAFTESPHGFTLWLENGPVECKGPLTSYILEKNGVTSRVKEAISGNAPIKNAASLPFQESWLLQLAHQWASTTYAPSSQASTLNDPLPLFSSFFTRQVTRNGLEKSLAWLKSKGVEVLKPQAIRDCAFSSNSMVSGLEIAGEKQGVYKLEQLVWMLTSEETYFMNETLGKYFYPAGVVESEWSWVRYRVSLQECSERQQLPNHTLLLEDVESPWSHENFLVIQRTTSQEQFDVWMRLPTVQRFNKEYLKERGDRVLRALSERMKLAQPEVLSFPQEYYYNYADLGPSRFPVFKKSLEQRTKRPSHKNIQVDGPEVWEQFAWESYFRRHQQIAENLVKWWQEKLLKEQKAKKEAQA